MNLNLKITMQLYSEKIVIISIELVISADIYDCQLKLLYSIKFRFLDLIAVVVQVKW